MFKKLFLGLVVLIVCVNNSFATEVYLKNGDRVSGDIIKQDDKQINIDSPVFGNISIDTKYIDHIGPKPEPVVEEPNPWSGDVSAGYSTQRGNTEKEELNASGSLKFKRKKVDEFDLKGNIYYSSSEKKMDAQKWYTMSRYARNFGQSKKWFAFVRGEIDHDKFADVYYRFLPAGGIGYWFIDTPDTKVMAEMGFGWEYTDYSSGKDSLSTATVIPHVYFEKTLWEKLKLSQDFIYYPSLSDFAVFRFRSETIASLKVFKNMSIKLSLIDEYNAAPPADAKKNDLQLVTAAVYTF